MGVTEELQSDHPNNGRTGKDPTDLNPERTRNSIPHRAFDGKACQLLTTPSSRVSTSSVAASEASPTPRDTPKRGSRAVQRQQTRRAGEESLEIFSGRPLSRLKRPARVEFESSAARCVISRVLCAQRRLCKVWVRNTLVHRADLQSTSLSPESDFAGCFCRAGEPDPHAILFPNEAVIVGTAGHIDHGKTRW